MARSPARSPSPDEMREASPEKGACPSRTRKSPPLFLEGEARDYKKMYEQLLADDGALKRVAGASKQLEMLELPGEEAPQPKPVQGLTFKDLVAIFPCQGPQQDKDRHYRLAPELESLAEECQSPRRTLGQACSIPAGEQGFEALPE